MHFHVSVRIGVKDVLTIFIVVDPFKDCTSLPRNRPKIPPFGTFIGYFRIRYCVCIVLGEYFVPITYL